MRRFKKEPIPHSNDLLICTTDMDTTLAGIIKTNNEFLVIDVSECTSSDLLMKLNVEFDKEALKFDFSQTEGALTTALKDGKKVILKGCFSEELMDSLAPLLLERQAFGGAGQVVILTDNPNTGTFMLNKSYHEVSAAEKRSYLLTQESKEEPQELDLNEPLSALIARQKCPGADPWEGLWSLPKQTNPSPQESQAFNKMRLDKVNAVLCIEPYVFLTGLSGVGKSTFVEKELAKTGKLYLGQDAMQAWANDKSAGRKILFIDEANLSPRQWSEFEGLYNTPPTILIHGALYPLTGEHKVVFAGNPVSYGDERRLAPFFQRHGNAILFTPLPVNLIREEILNPVFENFARMSSFDIAKRILEIYAFICDCSITDVLITPRELQMMALLTISRLQKTPGDPQTIHEQVCYDIAKHLVPKEHQTRFDALFMPKVLRTSDRRIPSLKEFLHTASRQPVSEQLNDFLDLRDWRRQANSPLNNPAQKAGGLGGMIIEGEPGIGKSELVLAELCARNFKENQDFYRMPVSMGLDEKKVLLIEAFKKGAIVIIDEINSSPMMERLLNDLLMGKCPGVDAKDICPGFIVIGTQNPPTMAGRRVTSSALQHRLITTVLPEYTKEEMKIILIGKGVELAEAEAMIQAYETNKQYAIKHHKSPVPNFRNLMTLANHHLRGIQAQPYPDKSLQETDPKAKPYSFFYDKTQGGEASPDLDPKSFSP